MIPVHLYDLVLIFKNSNEFQRKILANPTLKRFPQTLQSFRGEHPPPHQQHLPVRLIPAGLRPCLQAGQAEPREGDSSFSRRAGAKISEGATEGREHTDEGGEVEIGALQGGGGEDQRSLPVPGYQPLPKDPQAASAQKVEFSFVLCPHSQ